MCNGLVVDGVIAIPPMNDTQHLLNIVRSYGFAYAGETVEGYVRLELNGRVAEIAPCKIITEPAPSAIGYVQRTTPWVFRQAQQIFTQTTHYVRREFSDLVAEAYVVLADQGDEVMGIISHGYRQKTVESWAQQRSEAEAYMADKKTKSIDPSYVIPTPTLLSTLAATRGIELDELVNRVMVKVNNAAYITGIIIGSQQAAEDKIQAIVSASERPVDWWEQIVGIVETWQDSWPVWLEPPEDEFIIST